MHFFWEIICVCLKMHVYVCLCVYENRWENEVLHMKWRVPQITLFKCLNYLSNCNKQDFKINFKLLFKWTFAQNQYYRFSNGEQLSCSKFFELLHKNGRKIWISKYIGYFQMYSSFKFYLSNEASNELLPKRKLYISKFWASLVFKSFSFEAM